jgi:hypothetical protein
MLQRSQAIIHTEMLAMYRDDALPGITLKEAVEVMKPYAKQLSSIKADKRLSLMASTALIN